MSEDSARAPRPLIVLVDPAGPADPLLARCAAAAEGLGSVVHCSGGESALDEVLARRGADVLALVVLGPHVEAPIRCGRRLARTGRVDQLLFAVPRDQEVPLRRTLSYSGIGVPWALATADDPRLADTMATLMHSARQRRKFRTTLDRMNLRLQRSDVDPSAYRNLVVSHRYLDSILRHVADAIFSLDREGVVLTWNRGGEVLFGLDEREAVGRPIHTLAEWPPGTLPVHLARALEGEPQRFEADAGCAGRALTVDVTLTPVQDENGATMGLAAIVRDISERREAERERERVLAAERAARAELEHLGRVKDEFLAVLSHELKTPLSAVLGYAAVLQRVAGENPALANAAAGIARNARAQSRLIDELLDMSAINAGKLQLDLQAVDPVAVAQGAVESVRPAAAERNISIAVEAGDDCTHVHADPDRLLQIVSNLLTNAVKFSHEGGHIRVAVRRRGDMVEIAVADEGEGIDPAFLPHVFERFAQADSSSRRRHSGLGLGLSIVRQLVELHGGQVRAHSEGLGRGTTVTVALPVHHPAQHGDGHESADAGDSALGLRGMNVLIVDDEPDAREVLRLLLSTLGANPRVAGDADEGLELLQREPFDLLLSDISMPGRSGYEFVRSVRASDEPRLQALPAVAVTAFARAEDRREALRAGYDAHVAKPVELPALLSAIGRAVAREH